MVILERPTTPDDARTAAAHSAADRPRHGAGRRRRGHGPPRPDPPGTELGRVPALDGLRGLAMVLVVVSHVWIAVPESRNSGFGLADGLFRSGSLGVTIFLVLGGFLVTTSLLGQRAGTGTIAVRRFWARRLLRLGAPLAVMLGVFVVVMWAEGFPGTTPGATLDSVVRILTSSYNWMLLDVDPPVPPADLGHLWYLSVEQQFYVVWVLVLAVLGRFRRPLAALLAVATIAVVIRRATVWEEQWWGAASLRTDTRIDGLLLGALAAIAFAGGAAFVRRNRWLTTLGLLTMAALVVATGDDDTAYLGLVGIGFAAATTVVVLGLAVARGTAAARALAWRPLRVLGEVSYPAYLWHMPILYVCARHTGTWPIAARLLVATTAVAVAVVLTRRYVERPVAAWLARRDGLAPPRPAPTNRRRFTLAVTWGAVVGAIPFLMVLWDFGIRPFRTAVQGRIFSNFYDVQARALMDGHLDVPTGSLSIEAFHIGGRDYMYFPPFPSILRMPVLAVTDHFDSRLTAASMVLAWAVLVTFTALLLWRVRCVLRPAATVSRLEAFGAGGLVAVVGGGSVITFLAALPWVYHEAYLWATAFAVGFTWALIGVFERVKTGRILTAGGLALGAILSRTTAGWACCLAVIATAIVFVVAPRWRMHRRWAGGVAAAGIVPLLIGAAINWAKFRHPFMFSLEDQVWTRLNAHRREALAVNGGSLTGPQFFPTSLVNYFRPDGIRFTATFPFVTLPARPGTAVGGAFLDQTYRTGSVIAFMPLLFGLSVIGLWHTFRRRGNDAVAALRVPALGALAVAGGVMFYGYLAHRYTTEFVPGLVVLSAIGFVELGRRGRRWSPVRTTVATTGFVGIALFGIVANTAIGVTTARTTSRGTGLQNLVGLRLDVGDLTGTSARSIERGDDLDEPAATDRLRVLGECESVYLSTGDRYEPWIVVDGRGLDAAVTVSGVGGPGRVPIAAFEGATRRTVEVEHDGFGSYRVLVAGGGSEATSDWYLLEAGTTFRVTVSPRLDDGDYLIDSPAILFAGVPLADWDATGNSVPSRLRLAVPSTRLQHARGMRVDAHWLPPSRLCLRLLDTLGDA